MNESPDVGRLDYSDLRCCGKAMTMLPDRAGHQCSTCRWTVTQIAFMQNHHGSPTARRARIANKEVGYAA